MQSSELWGRACDGTGEFQGPRPACAVETQVCPGLGALLLGKRNIRDDGSPVLQASNTLEGVLGHGVLRSHLRLQQSACSFCLSGV